VIRVAETDRTPSGGTGGFKDNWRGFLVAKNRERYHCAMPVLAFSSLKTLIDGL
jgi:hypothetical protein